MAHTGNEVWHLCLPPARGRPQLWPPRQTTKPWNQQCAPSSRLHLSASLPADKPSRAVWAPATREKIIKKMTLAGHGGAPDSLSGDINTTETGSTTFPEKGQRNQHLTNSAIRGQKVTSCGSFAWLRHREGNPERPPPPWIPLPWLPTIQKHLAMWEVLRDPSDLHSRP